MWAVDPTIQSDLFNVHGVAHKVVFSIDANTSQATDGNADLTKLPLYDALNDDSIQHFERRFAFNTFGTPIGVPLSMGGVPALPLQFDPRFYALRRGMDEWVTGPTEIAGDQTVIRFDVDQRWQTKRGPCGDQHIIDWITLDTNLEIFPDSKENFGASMGQFNYDFHWYVGDRTTIVSSGITDFFGDSDKEFTIGAYLNRGGVGSYYVGYFFLGGPISQQTIASSMTYRLSPKWALTFGSSFNLVPATDLTESLLLTRIGESFLMTFGVSADASTGSVGASFLLEPRSFGKTRLSRSGFDVGAAGRKGWNRKQGRGARNTRGGSLAVSRVRRCFPAPILPIKIATPQSPHAPTESCIHVCRYHIAGNRRTGEGSGETSVAGRQWRFAARRQSTLLAGSGQMEDSLHQAVTDAGYELVRAHPFKPEQGHGFIGSQKEGMEVFAGIDPHCPADRRRGGLAILASPAARPALAPGADSDRGQLVGHVAGAGRHAQSERLAHQGRREILDALERGFHRSSVRQGARSLARKGQAAPSRPTTSLALARRESRRSTCASSAQALAEQLQREKAIMGVFDEGCMGMFNAIIPDHLLNPTGVYKERLSQSALYYETTQVERRRSPRRPHAGWKIAA